MKCEQVEYLLPSYIEKDLPAEKMNAVEAHLSGCSVCRESLAVFMRLEETLIERREDIPPIKNLTTAVLSRIGYHRTRAILRCMFSLPSVASASFAILGIVAFIHNDKLRALFSRDTGIGAKLVHAAQRLTDAIVQFAQGDVWVLMGIYVGLTMLLLLGMSLVVLNFMRAGR